MCVQFCATCYTLCPLYLGVGVQMVTRVGYTCCSTGKVLPYKSDSSCIIDLFQVNFSKDVNKDTCSLFIPLNCISARPKWPWGAGQLTFTCAKPCRHPGQ